MYLLFCIKDLISQPQDGWPNALAETVASNALDVIKSAKLYATLDEALSDLTFVYAATARTNRCVPDVSGRGVRSADS